MHLLCQLRDLGMQDSVQMEQVLTMLQGYVEFQHHPFATHAPDRKQ